MLRIQYQKLLWLLPSNVFLHFCFRSIQSCSVVRGQFMGCIFYLVLLKCYLLALWILFALGEATSDFVPNKQKHLAWACVISAVLAPSNEQQPEATKERWICQTLCLPVWTLVGINDQSLTSVPGINQAHKMQSRNDLKQWCNKLELNCRPLPVS